MLVRETSCAERLYRAITTQSITGLAQCAEVIARFALSHRGTYTAAALAEAQDLLTCSASSDPQLGHTCKVLQFQRTDPTTDSTEAD
jgi:hypothetical protein